MFFNQNNHKATAPTIEKPFSFRKNFSLHNEVRTISIDLL